MEDTMATDDFIPAEEEAREGADSRPTIKPRWEPITAPEDDALVLEDPTFAEEISSEDLHGVVSAPMTHEPDGETQDPRDASEEAALEVSVESPVAVASSEHEYPHASLSDERKDEAEERPGLSADDVLALVTDESSFGHIPSFDDSESAEAEFAELNGLESVGEAELVLDADPVLEADLILDADPVHESDVNAEQVHVADISDVSSPESVNTSVDAVVEAPTHSSADNDSVVDAPEVLSTTTIPVVAPVTEDTYVPSDLVPEDVLEARDADNPSTTAIRRDLVTPQEEEASAAPSWESAVVPPAALAAQESHPTGQTPDSLSDTIFEGATVVPVVPSRAKAHFMSFFLGLFLIPAGWYLFADASARMLFPANAPVTTGVVSWLALGEFSASIVLWLLFLLLTLRSSVGAWVWGILLTIAGIPWLVVPGLMMQHTSAAFEWVKVTGGVLGANLAHHIQLSAYSGRFMLMGLTLLAMAIIAVVVRRRGRAEEALRAQVAKVNPEGAFLSRAERRRAEKAARKL